MKTGFCIKTIKYQLRCSHAEWFISTEGYYRDVLNFYYHLLLHRKELWNLNTFQMQRELECLTIEGRDGRKPVYPLPFSKVPLYFRRSAINKAIGCLKSHLGLSRSVDKTEEYDPPLPETIDASLTYFKGMYREFTDTGITLKVWDGSSWHWMECRLKGSPFPANAMVLSPSVVPGSKICWLHVPVKQETTQMQEMQRNE